MLSRLSLAIIYYINKSGNIPNKQPIVIPIVSDNITIRDDMISVSLLNVLKSLFSIYLPHTIPVISDRVFPNPAEAIVDIPSIEPNVRSIALPDTIITPLSIIPKIIKALATLNTLLNVLFINLIFLKINWLKPVPIRITILGDEALLLLSNDTHLYV